MAKNGFDYDEDEYVEEEKIPFRFDDAVSFTMYLEVLLIFSSILIFLFYLYLVK